jgi:glycosyltransferase involved in cell wall biosynthesis
VSLHATRVLVLNERDPRHPKAGGAEVHVAEIFRRLAERGLEVTLVSSGFPGSAHTDEIEGMQVVRLGGLPFFYPRAAAFCRRETGAGRADLVVDCLNKLPFLSPLYAKAPVLALCHHLFGEAAFLQVPWPIAATVWGVEKWIPRVYRDCPFVAISESTRDDLVARGLSSARIEVHHPGIQFPEVPISACETRAPSIVYVGRLEPYKNIDVLLRAAARLRPKFPEIALVVIGEGADRPRLERLAGELGMDDRIRFTGFIDEAEKNRRMAEARVCVCPSAKEGWGLTVIESNAVGTPNVASDAPGLRDSVRDGETGFLVPIGDEAGFAGRIETLLGDDAVAARMSRAALDWSAGFTWEHAADQMEHALAAALKRGAR